MGILGSIWEGIKKIKLHTWVLLIFIIVVPAILIYWVYLDITGMGLPDFFEIFKKVAIVICKVLLVPFSMWFGFKLSRHFVETYKAKSLDRQATAVEQQRDAQVEIAKAMKKP